MMGTIILAEMESKVFILTHKIDLWQILSDGVKSPEPKYWKPQEKDYVLKRAK